MKKIFIALFAIVLLFTQSCVKDQIYEGPATISDIAYSPTAVGAEDNVTVTATITDLKGITSATLKYKVGDGSFTDVNMTASGTTYSGTIPNFPDLTVITYYIEVVNSSNYTTTSDEYTYTVAGPYAGLRLNELNGNDKFIELYNGGISEINLEGIYIEKDEEVNWTCNARTLAVGAYLLLYSEDVVLPGEAQDGYDPTLVFASGLSAKKNVRVQLFDPDGNSLDDFHLTSIAKTAPASYSRGNDGVWYHAAATPNAANAASTEIVEGLE